jgi:hypothetical protein
LQGYKPRTYPGLAPLCNERGRGSAITELDRYRYGRKAEACSHSTGVPIGADRRGCGPWSRVMAKQASGMGLTGRLSNFRVRAMIHELSETGD